MAKAIKWDTIVFLAAFMCLAVEIDSLLHRLREIQDLKASLHPAPATVRAIRPAASSAGLERNSTTPTHSPPEIGANPRAARLRAAMLDPAFLRHLAVLQRQMISEHYRALFEALRLDPADRDRFTALLEMKQLEKSDAEDAAYANGLFGTGAVIPAVEAAQKDVNGEIAQLLGADKYAEYYNFEMTDGMRNSLKRLQGELQDTTEPISDATVEDMVAALDRALPADQRGGVSQFTGPSAEIATGLGSPLFSAVLPANAADLLAQQLSASQTRRLRALMEQQRNEMALRSLLLDSAGHPGASSP